MLIILVGGGLIAITATGRFTSYVRPGFGPLLITAGIVLMITGALSLILSNGTGTRFGIGGAARAHPVRDLTSGQDEGAGAAVPETDSIVLDAHGHSHSSRAPWLIMAPILVLLLAPPALGSDAVSRSAGSQAVAGAQPVQVVTGDGGYAPNDGSGSATTGGASGGMAFPPLPDIANPPLALKLVVQRALYDSTGSVTNRSVTVLGFIAPAGTGFTDGYSIARLVISCCAADGNPMQLHGAGSAPFPPNTWVQAVVSAIPGSGTPANYYVPTVKITSISKIGQPSDPYEH